MLELFAAYVAATLAAVLLALRCAKKTVQKSDRMFKDTEKLIKDANALLACCRERLRNETE